VGQQKLRWPLVVTVLAHQALEHHRHGAWVVAGPLQVDQADAVGLLFVLPGEAPLFLDGGGLGRGDRRDAGIARARRGGDDACEQGGHHR